MNRNYERALLLYQQNRHEQAGQHLRQVLATDPHDPHAHALLALCLVEQKDYAEATREAQQAIALAPDLSFVHYAHARVLSERNRESEALAAIREAIRLDPQEADFCALEAGLLVDLKQWPEALAAAERGLQLDAEHVACTNLRAIALVKLGRQAEAGRTIDAALARNPDNAVTHANQGWTLLHAGDANRALEHFREALRLDPTNEWARAGIVEALKARNPIYALMLKYFLFMGRLSSQAQWGIIIGGYVLSRTLGELARQNPELAPWVLPLRILYVTFAIMTWLASRLFNLLLRLNRFGRLALSAEQVTESNWVGGFVLAALISLGGCLVMGFGSPWLTTLAVFGLMLMPVSGVFRCDEGWPRWTMLAAAGALFLLGLRALGLTWKAYLSGGNDLTNAANRGLELLVFFSIGILCSAFLANHLATQKVRR